MLFIATLGFGASDSRAAASVDITWISTTGSGTTGTNSINADPGDRIVAEITLTPDPIAGLSGFGISFEFDLANKDVLDLVSFNFNGPGTWGQFVTLTGTGVLATQESTTSQKGHLLTTAAGDLFGFYPTTAKIVIGTITFDVTANGSSAGASVLTGDFNADMDAVADLSGNLMNPVYGSASALSALGEGGGGPVDVVFGNSVVNESLIAVPALSPWGLVALLSALCAASIQARRCT